MDADEIRGWTPSLALLATFVPFGLAITVFRVRRDVYLEQMPPLPVLLGVLARRACWRCCSSSSGRGSSAAAGRLAGRCAALALLAAVVGLGAVPARRCAAPKRGRRPPVDAAVPPLADPQRDPGDGRHAARRPPVLLRRPGAETPNLCRLLATGGSIFDGFSHASWTKPATATLVTSLLPSSHGAMSKPAALLGDVVTLSEVLQERGYATGGIVSNINLAPSFGFDQGYDEYHYLGTRLPRSAPRSRRRSSSSTRSRGASSSS